jgi:hypothetical protein
MRPTSRSRATGSICIAPLTRPVTRSIFCCAPHRDKAAAQRYFEKSIDQNGEPETVTIDKSGANLAALEALNAGRDTPIKIRQNKYLNNIVEQDHRAIKRRTRPMLGFKTFRCARILLGGIELTHMIVKGQMQNSGSGQTPAEQFYSLSKSAFLIISIFICPPFLLRQNPFFDVVGAKEAAVGVPMPVANVVQDALWALDRNRSCRVVGARNRLLANLQSLLSRQMSAQLVEKNLRPREVQDLATTDVKA